MVVELKDEVSDLHEEVSGLKEEIDELQDKITRLLKTNTNAIAKPKVKTCFIRGAGRSPHHDCCVGASEMPLYA